MKALCSKADKKGKISIMKKIIACTIMLSLFLSVCGCNHQTEEKGEFTFPVPGASYGTEYKSEVNKETEKNKVEISVDEDDKSISSEDNADNADNAMSAEAENGKETETESETNSETDAENADNQEKNENKAPEKEELPAQENIPPVKDETPEAPAENKQDEAPTSPEAPAENKQDEAPTSSVAPAEKKQEETTSPSSPSAQPTLTTIQQQKPINKPATYTGDKYLLLVNPWNYLPDDFKRNTRAIEGHYIDVGAYDDIVQMLADMRNEGLKPYICSSTRTIDYQQNLFNNRLAKNKAKGLSAQEALDETAKWTAIPGTSEHHTGYALDIVSTYNTSLDSSQENTPEQQWMMKNSWKYGFILRYPDGKTDITGIYYEPWHYRYVGKTAAKEIYEAGITLEEYVAR